MQVIQGNLWDFHAQGDWIAITTNGTINARHELVMGRGIAGEAKLRYPALPKFLAYFVEIHGNVPVRVQKLFDMDTQEPLGIVHLVTFPTKHGWWERSNVSLIRESADHILRLWTDDVPLYMPKPGCGFGQLYWADVEPILDQVFNGDERFIVVDHAG